MSAAINGRNADAAFELAPPSHRGARAHKSEDLGAMLSKDVASRIISNRPGLTIQQSSLSPLTLPSEHQVQRRTRVMNRRASTGICGNDTSQAALKIKSSKRSIKCHTSLSSEEDASNWSLDMECLSSDHTTRSNVRILGSHHQRQEHRTLRHSSANLGASSNPSSSSLAFNMSNVSEDTFAISNTTTAAAARAMGSTTGVGVSNCFGGLTADEVKLRKKAKTDQIVESLVWFSFHTPRAVLEDLISHELDLYQIQQHEKAVVITAPKAGRNDDSETKLTQVKVSNLQLGSNGDSDVGGSMIDGETWGSSLDERPRGTRSFKGGECELHLDEKSLRRLVETTNGSSMMMTVPKAVYRQSALLFIDLSGFTRLTTLLDLEALSKVINSYFDMIVSEVILNGGDILKFAGDAIFAEWKVTEDDGECAAEGIDEVGADGKEKRRKKKKKNRSHNALAELNASLASISDLDFDGSVPKLSLCILSAARCGASIVKKFSDYQVMSAAKGTSEAMLNVHCGIGVGNLVGLHVGDYKEGHEEGSVELRREFLFLGDPIDQVARAADAAKDGEVLASPEAILSLAFCCKVSDGQRASQDPIRIAMRDQVYFDILDSSGIGDGSNGLQTYESISMHCKALNHTALARLHLQMALYVHPVIRGDELGIAAAIQAGTISRPKEELERRHRAEAELRSVLTIFIKAIISPRVTGMRDVDGDLYRRLNEIMHVASRELDRYSGQLRQFIVDDKGVILIATFGLRGSMFPNLVSSHGLPAIFSIHRALKSELKVENRIGATFGKAYCGVVGGIRRHEFAVMGPAVNLAARLMSSKVNKGILVDEEVQMQADSRYSFNSLPPVMAKGYDKPVPILEPVESSVSANRRRKSSVPFVGRTMERETILNAASEMLEDACDKRSTMIFLFGESGMGKSFLGRVAVEEIKKRCSDVSKTVVSARSSSTETAQRIPLSTFKQIFMKLVHDFWDIDGSFSDSRSKTSSCVESSCESPGSELLIEKDVGGSNRVCGGEVSHDQRDNGCAMKDRVNQSVHERGAKSPSNKRQLLRKVEGGKRLLPSFRMLAGQSSHAKGSKMSRHEGLSAQSLHRPTTPKPFSKEYLGQSLHRLGLARSASLSGSSKSRVKKPKDLSSNDDSSHSFDHSFNTITKVGVVNYFERLCWVCEQIRYPFEMADIVGSLLGLDGANSSTVGIEGQIPTLDEISQFLALVLIFVANCAEADLLVLTIDDFQYVDNFSWEVLQSVCQESKAFLICPARSHDKQVLRRRSAAAAHSILEISLAPMTFADIREVTAATLRVRADSISDSFCSDVFQRTAGLPIYVVQALEAVNRKKTATLDENGELQWTSEGLKEKHAFSSNKGVFVEETFLSRFDILNVRLRLILQTCAVLGQSFALSDVVKVLRGEMGALDIEVALEDATEEMILIENIDEDDGDRSLRSASTGTGDAATRLRDGARFAERHFQFSHAMWRQNVLKTMLKERTTELHRRIAESMEEEASILDQSDISRQLTLFYHWKACGDFINSARLSLVVGERLVDYELYDQAMELFEEALVLAYEAVARIESDLDNEDWMQVSAKPDVLDYLLRLHIRLGLCHQRLGEEDESIQIFEDAYNIIKTSSWVPARSASLIIPIISSLCVLKLNTVANDARTRLEHEKLVEKFIKEAVANGNSVHVGRALAMEAGYYATRNQLERAILSFEKLRSQYDIKANSQGMVQEYSRDFALECCSEAVLWNYLLERHEAALQLADHVIHYYLPLLAECEADVAMYVIFPLVQVFKLVGRARDAEVILKDFVVRPYQEGSPAEFWEPIFNPLAYLLDLIAMEDNEEYDERLLDEIEAYALDDRNQEYVSRELEPKAHTVLGEICWRLVDFKGTDDPSRRVLRRKARELLVPIAANTAQADVFLRYTAQALVDAL